MKEIKKLPQHKKLKLVQAIKEEINSLKFDISTRNSYVDELDNILFDDNHILSGLDVPKGHDLTKYNFLRRAWEIHSCQAGGRGFSIFSKFNKESLDGLEEGTPEYEEILLRNKAEIDKSSARTNVARAIFDDNGGRSLVRKVSDIAGAYGFCVIKGYLDENDIYRFIPLEKPKSYIAGWSSDNFKERDFDACVYQISYSKARRTYGEYIEEGDDFVLASNDGNTSDPLSMLKDADTGTSRETSRKMVTVLEYTGYLGGIEEYLPDMKDRPFSALIVGNKIVAFRTNRLPKYYMFINKEVPGKAYGESDISKEAIDINKTYILLMSRYMAILDRSTFSILKAINFKPTNIPTLKAGRSHIVPMTAEQDLSAVGMNVVTYPYDRVLNEQKEALFRVLGLGRVLIDDPRVSFESSQALMIGMKSTIDIAEYKQSRWEPLFVQMLNDAIIELSKISPELRATLDESGDPQIFIKWPSILRKEDASYRTMWLNDFSRGAISLQTYLETIGIDDIDEEMDRIASTMKDPVLGAIPAGNLRQINALEIEKKLGAMQQEQPQQPQANHPMLTAENNQPEAQPMSQPGSGAPTVPAEEYQAMIDQNQGL